MEDPVFPKDTKEFVEIGRKNGNFIRTIEAAIKTNDYQKIKNGKKNKKTYWW